MGRVVMSVSKYGINIDYKCKSLYSKYHGRKCKDFGTSVCLKCDLCYAEMKATDVVRLLKGLDKRYHRT